MLHVKSHRILTFLLALAFGMACGYAQTTYYMSSINGDNSNSGTSPSAPWRSMFKLNGILSSLQQGDSVLFERGSSWYEVEMYLNNVSGTSDQPIYFGVYGEGSRPVLSGGKLLADFTRDGNHYSVPINKDFNNGNIKVPVGILINGKWMDIARSPEYFTTGTNSRNQIVDASQSWASNSLVDGYIFAQAVQWQWQQSRITSNSSSSINFNTIDDFLGSGAYFAYYVTNSEHYLIEDGDWVFKDRELIVNYSSDLNEQNVQFGVVDSVLSISNSSHVKIQNIIFELSNYRLLTVQNCDAIEINTCEFRYTAGTAVKCSRTDYFTFVNNYVHDCDAAGIWLYVFGPSEVEQNLFKNIATKRPGMANYDYRMSPAVTIQYPVNSNPKIRYNFFDSVGIAVQGHTFNVGESMDLSCNYVQHYGNTVSDCGAFYFASDLTSNTNKYISRNIILDAVTAGNRYLPYGSHASNPHPVLHPHAIYIDEGGKGYVCDSNTIHNTSIPFYLNRNYKNSFKYNNVVNGDMHIADQYNGLYFRDQVIGDMEYSADRDTLRFNNLVLSNNSDAVAYIRHTTTEVINDNIDRNEFITDYNKILSPYNSNPFVGKYVTNYGTGFNSYTLNQMRNNSDLFSANSSDHNTTINSQGIMYTDVSGTIDEQDFVKFFTNFSRGSKVFSLGSAEFYDVDGNVVTGTIEIPPFYSEILFYRSGDVHSIEDERYIDSTIIPAFIMDEHGFFNLPPQVDDAVFTIIEGEFTGGSIGNVDAVDPNYGQALHYSIIAGDPDHIFTIDQAGRLFFTDDLLSFEGSVSYQLTIQVTDNGSPSMSSEAVVFMHLVDDSFNTSPNIEDQEFIYHVTPEGNSEVGIVTASDPDEHSITYEIVSNTPDNLYSIDPETGMLFVDLNVQDILVPEEHHITVEVEDDGIPQQASQAQITIRYIPAENIVYIDPTIGVEGDGSYEQPYQNITSVPLEAEHMYLIKRGTRLVIDVWNINADDIIIGAYGEGAEPVITSSTTEYVIRISDRDRIVLKDIHVDAPNSRGGFYLSGTGNGGINLSNCSADGSHYGIRALDAAYLHLEYCTFTNTSQGGFIVADEADVNYCIFESNTLGLNVISNGLGVIVLNNLFIDNRDALTFSGDHLLVYNNIFYLSEASDRALVCTAVELISDHNIYYPQRDDFILINGTSYSGVSELISYQHSDYSSVSADPKFRDLENKNYTLQGSSPGIDGGAYVGLPYDIHGRPIPEGAAPDIGIIESSGLVNDLEENESIYQVNSEDELHIYPNPASSQLYVQIPGERSGSATIELYTIAGQKVYQNTVQKFVDTPFSVPIDTYQAGVYLLKVNLQNQVFVGRFLKSE